MSRSPSVSSKLRSVRGVHAIKLRQHQEAKREVLHSQANWRAVREEFSLTPSRLHLASFLLSSHPRTVTQAIDRFRQLLDADPQLALIEQQPKLTSRAAESLARLLSVSPNNIALTSSTTEGLGSLIAGLQIHPTSEVLISGHEHYSTVKAIHTARFLQRLINVRQYQLYDSNDARTLECADILKRLEEAISQQTRLLIVTWVHSSSGVRLPLNEISALISRINRKRSSTQRLRWIVDGTHGVGAFPINLGDLGCDAFVGSCHKWMYGPRGTGFIYLNENADSLMAPVIPTFDNQVVADTMGYNLPSSAVKKVGMGELFSSGGFCAFEHRWAISASVEFIEGIGQQRISERILMLSDRLKRGITENPKLRLVSPTSKKLSSGIVSFSVNNCDPNVASERLRQNGLTMMPSPYPERLLRLSPGIINSEEDIDQAISILADSL